MNTVAWIGFYLDNDFFNKVAISQNFPIPEQIPEFIEHLKPLHVTSLDVSLKGKITQEAVILAPLLIKHFALLEKKIIQTKIITSVELALSKRPAIICLAGPLGEYVPYVKEKLKIETPLITGKKLLSATIIRNIEKMARASNLNLQDKKIAIFDMLSPVGRICAEIASEMFGEVVIYSKNDTYGRIEHGKNIRVLASIEDTLKKASFVINTYLMLPQTIIDRLEPGAIFLDAVVPFWATRTLRDMRKDVTAIESAWQNGSFLDRKQVINLLPPDKLYACMAETILFGLENSINPVHLEINALNAKIIGEKARILDK
jgi:predicted amino acid dehydrogenase